MFFDRNHTRTTFIQLDTQKCKACWKCLKNCSNHVIGKVDLSWHKHVLIDEPEACSGCLICVNICQYKAYSISDGTTQEIGKLRKRTFNNFIINNLLLIFGLGMIFSGLVMQVGYHMGSSQSHSDDAQKEQFQSIQYEQLRELNTSKIVYGFTYHDWSMIHKFVIVFFLLFMVYHTFVHWKWYKGVINKHQIGNNRQTIILFVSFLLVTLTSLIPWLIDLSGGTSILRMLFIEIHDKITLILIVLLILHVIKRYKWFLTTFKKL